MTTTIAPEAHEHVIHLKVSWETYETLVADSGENRRALLSYDGETLELMAPNADHEAHKTLVEALLAILVLEWDFNLYGTGSTTFQTKPVGAEPDTSYYVANAANVAFLEKIDLATSPPPDLVIEIDMSRSRMDKSKLYATIGVPEFWRIDEGGLRAFTVIDGAYAATGVSIVIPGLPISELGRFLERRLEVDRRAVYRNWQAWLREHLHLHRTA
jgi:Uma2 family endonuclease